MEITISANVVAWYAALVSTVAVVLNVMQYLRDRINIALECTERIIVGDNVAPYKKDTVYLSIIIRNKGREPVTIEKVGFLTKGSDKDMILTDSFDGPRVVNGGQNTTYLVEKDLVNLTRIKRAYASDGAGRVHKSKRLTTI